MIGHDLMVCLLLLHVVPKVHKVYRVEEVEEEKEKENLKPSRDLNWKDIKFMIDRNDYRR